MRKQTIYFPIRSDTNQPVPPQKQARFLKFWILKTRDSTIRVVKTKELISCAITAQLICVLLSHMKIDGFLVQRLILSDICI